MDWREDYKRKFVSEDEAVKVIKSGDYVAFAYGLEPLGLGLALAARKDELTDLWLLVPAPGRDFPWYDTEIGWKKTFSSIEIAHVLPIVQDMVRERRADFLVGGLHWTWDPVMRKQIDVLIIQLSPPDEHGFCSFGASLWDKKRAVKSSKIVLAEVNPNLIRTYGDNFIHVSEINYFVEHVSSGRMPGATDMLGRKTTGPGEVEKRIAENVASQIKDGDTLEIGVGGTAEWVVRLGALDNKMDLGWHSENTVPGVVRLVQKGVMTGARKTFHKGKVVATACGGDTKENMDFINNNPLFELYSSDYMLDPRVIAAQDNMVAINSALAIDLTGQIAAESIGHTMVSSTGGQLAYAIGSNMSKGGANITVLTSTTKDEAVSRIVARFEPGTIVTTPRTLADIIITEYGVAKLKGKTQRQRAEALISIAHPDFREELRKEARRLFWS
ncbi:putative butyrate:acetyl-CoA coenzyme A-transferase [subsurface metagenome]